MKKRNLLELLLLVLLVTLVFGVISFANPTFFVCDDNQNYFLNTYRYSYCSLRDGDITFYNFHQFLGVPFFATGQTGTLNPLVILSGLICEFIFRDFARMVDVVVYFCLVLAAVGMFLLLRKQKISIPVSYVGALAWAFNTSNLFLGRSWMIAILVSACIPFVLLGTSYLYENLSLKGVLLSALPKIFLFHSGHPQFFIWGIIFDFFYMLLFCIWVNKNDSRNKKFIIYYFLSLIPVALMALPLLGPMYHSMSMSGGRNGSMPFDYFIDYSVDYYALIPGVVYPFAKLTGEITNWDVVLGRVGGFTIILMILFVVGIALLFVIKDLKLRRKLIALDVIAFITLISAGSTLFLHILYYVPVLNKFRYPVKYMLWFPAFAIIAACLVLEFLLNKYVSKKSLKNLLFSLLVVLTSVNVLVVALFATGSYWGVKMPDTLNDAPADFEETYSGKRYICVATDSFSHFEEGNIIGDSIYQMNFNLATYYGLSNALGYDTLTPSQVVNRFGDGVTEDYLGALYPTSIDFLTTSDYLGISTFVVSNDWIECNPSIFASDDYTLVSEGDSWKTYYKDDVEAIVRTSEGEALDYEEQTNSIIVRTDSSFEGGEILLMYSYNPYFEVYVNGHKSDIKVSENQYYTMKLDAPSGENTIEVRYHDRMFDCCLIVTFVGMAIFIGTWIIVANKKNEGD